jgi:hypothetical protein
MSGCRATGPVAVGVDDDGTTLAGFAYLGLDTRVQMTYPEALVQLTLIQQAGEPVGDGGDQYVGLDRFGRLVDQRWLDGSGADIERVQYGYDRASNKVWRQNPVATALSAAQDEYYTQDGLYQLAVRQQGTLNGSHTGISGTPAAEEDFTYDPTGNWTNYEIQAAGSPTLEQARTHNLDNEITTLAGDASLVAYDQAGNMTTTPQPNDASWSSTYTLTWDAWNRLVQVQGSSGLEDFLTVGHSYDGLTRRLATSIEQVTDHHPHLSAREYFYSDQWKVLEESTSGEGILTDTRQFVWRGCDEDKLILRDWVSAATRTYVLDDGKNVTAVYDMNDGDIEERYGYSAFGAPVFMDGDFNVIDGSSYDWETFFCGYRYDTVTELYQVRYRYFPPNTEVLRLKPQESQQRIPGRRLCCKA